MDYITLNNGLKMPLLGFGTMNIFVHSSSSKIFIVPKPKNAIIRLWNNEYF